MDIKTTPFLAEHLPAARGRLPQARRRADRRHGHRAAEQRSRGQPRRRRVDPRRQGVGGRAGLHPRLGRPHLPHEDGGRSVQADCIGSGWKPTAGDGESRQLSGHDRGAGRAHHRRGHAAQRADADRVRRGLARRARRQGHRQPGGQARHPPGADGGPRHRAHVGGPDRAAHPPPRPNHRRPRRHPRLRARQAAARGGVRGHPRPSSARRTPRRRQRYRKALQIAMRWIKNYTDLDFRSLGSYTRPISRRSRPRPTPSKRAIFDVEAL